ncbi:TIGR01457 family HAD-type hydrolase [Halobacillus campisalis]|uniref:Acid sugar phosphatase n=1 Tax=Halobacillus campisalis TaxID=435909 RepID=A0ABW2K752_9BACI|nr:TIGR01457 family HAD-type hydrolase [Halobacillus campisalis]
MVHYKAYLIDLDGTMYRGNEKIPGAAEFIKELNQEGIPHLFVTNNSATVPEKVAEKLMKMGIDAREEQIFNSSMAAAKYIRLMEHHAKAYVIGEEGLYSALENENIQIVDDNADYVVIGIDRGLTYEKLAKACLQIRNGAKLISTNKDVAIPTERGMVPGNGAITSVISVSTGIDPVFAGKPEPILMEQAIEKLGFSKKDVLMVGDNYDTDILAGIHSGIDTLMVETGVSTFESIKHYDEQPTYKITDLYKWKLDRK